MTRLVAVPNVSEGRDEAVLDAIGAAFARHADVLDRSADPDHHRAVFFLAGAPGRAAPRARRRRGRGGRADRPAPPRRPAPARRRARRRAGRVPRRRRSAARRSPRRCSPPTRSARAGIPVFLYGELAGGRTRAELRKRRAGGARRARAPRPTTARAELHPTAGATLVAARAAADRLQPRARAARDARGRARDRRAIRAGGAEGLPGVRALGLHLRAPRRRSRSRPTSRTTAPSRRPTCSAPSRATTRSRGAELVAPAPEAALAGWPDDVELRMPARDRSPARRANVSGPWPRPSASAGPSTAATPPARSRRAAAPAASRPRRSAQERARASRARGPPLRRADVARRRDARRPRRR